MIFKQELSKECLDRNFFLHKIIKKSVVLPLKKGCLIHGFLIQSPRLILPYYTEFEGYKSLRTNFQTNVK
jgi:hypothetical protein